MEVLAMGLHVRERWKLRHIEEGLRREDPGLDALLAGRSPPGKFAPSGRPASHAPPSGRPASHAPLAGQAAFHFHAPPAGVLVAVGVLAAYLVPPAFLASGLLLHVTWLIVAGAVLCPLIPVTAWLLIRRHVIHGGLSHCRKS